MLKGRLQEGRPPVQRESNRKTDARRSASSFSQSWAPPLAADHQHDQTALASFIRLGSRATSIQDRLGMKLVKRILDTREALVSLANNFRIGLLSNIDDI